MPQSVWCRITRCPLLGGWPWPSRPSRAHERSVAGVIRPPMLRITTPSPSSRPSTSLGSTRESTQPSTCRVSLVGKGRPANAPVAANAALRRTRSSEEIITSSERTRRRTSLTDPITAHLPAELRGELLEPLGVHYTWMTGTDAAAQHPKPTPIRNRGGQLDLPLAFGSMGPDGGLIGTGADAVGFLRALHADPDGPLAT